jgi:hypothetical protein
MKQTTVSVKRRFTSTTVSPTDYHSTSRSIFTNHRNIRHCIVSILTGSITNQFKKGSIRDVVALKEISTIAK